MNDANDSVRPAKSAGKPLAAWAAV